MPTHCNIVQSMVDIVLSESYRIIPGCLKSISIDIITYLACIVPGAYRGR